MKSSFRSLQELLDAEQKVLDDTIATACGDVHERNRAAYAAQKEYDDRVGLIIAYKYPPSRSSKRV